MRKLLAAGAVSSVILGLAAPAAAQHPHAGMNMQGTKAQAVAMVKKGVAYIQAFGQRKAYAEINDPDGQFTDRSLYLVVYGLDGEVLAHGHKLDMVGRNMLGYRDPGGKQVVKVTVERAHDNDEFWVKHTMDNPMTQQVEPMEMYCERLKDTVICSGHFMG